MDNAGKINLPGTPQDVASIFKDDSASDEVKATIRKYSGGALITGRPLDSLQIILSGYSGSGKSSTINFLFDDPELCRTSSSKSETRDPVMVQKRLVCSQAKGPPVEGTLSLVDLPGQFDSDNRRDVCNLASIRKFIDSMFASREGISISDLEKSGSKIRPSVYPNLVLFVLCATDNRLQGNGTNLRKALMVIQKIGNLVDAEHPNLIILITHACSLGLHATYFNEDLNEKKTIIRQVVKEVLGISDVDIIPIENRPERYQLQKCGDYYKLPNEELSHYNLYQAMLKRMERNNDNIGQLFASWYFQSSCPEKQSSAEAVLPTIDVDYSDLAKAAAELHILQKGTDPINPVTIFKFDYLGYGYCPATEKVKLNLLSKREAECVQNMKQVEIKGAKFMIPKYVAETMRSSSKFQRLTFLNKSEYQEHMKSSYGMDESMELNMITESDSKWMTDIFDRRGIRRLAFSQEVQLSTFRIVLPAKFFKDSVFYKELMGLPVDFKSEETAKTFLAFFAKWGTHLIYEEAVGGSMELNCTINQSSAKVDNVSKIEKTVGHIFADLLDKPCTLSSLPPMKDRVNSLRTVGVIQENLKFLGGNEPEYIEWDNATFEDVDKWKQSISQKPVELKKSIRLIPFYELLDKMDKDNPRYNSLYQATKRYLQDPSGSCFPEGTQVHMGSGETKAIEQLGTCHGEKLLTVGIDGVFPTSLRLEAIKTTEFCTFLDKKPNELVAYLVLHFSNGKKLTVSPGHMIFQFLKETDSVVGKQAKNFLIGDMAVYYMNTTGSIEYPAIENISQEMRVGAYGPLTWSGTFIADGFLVSSYADIDSFTVAEGALLPLKLWCKLNGKRGTGSVEMEAQQRNGIHPYAKFLMSVRNLLKARSAPK